MLKGISYWSTPEGLENTQDIGEALSLAKDAGFEAIELGIGPEGELTTASTQAQCEAFRKQVDDSGLACETLASGMSWGFNPTSDDASVRDRCVELHAAAIERAGWLGCEAMLFVPGVVTSPIAPDEVIRYDVAIERARAAIERLLEPAERLGVDLCIENVWNGLLLSPLELADFVDRIGSERLGVYFDVGNLVGYHQHPPHWIELLGERIRRVHVKDFRLEFDWNGSFSFCRLGEGDVPWPETMAALREIGYDRTIIAEMLPYSDGLLEHTSRALDEILAG